MEEKWNISDIAAELGISISTVSRALNGKKGVSEKQRKKILEYAQKVNYRTTPLLLEPSIPNPLITKIVAIVLGDIRNPFYTDLVFNIQQRLNESGYMVVVFNTEYDVEREINQLRMIQKENFSGLIPITTSNTQVRDIVAEIDMPMVMVNRIVHDYEGSSVMTDNFQAGYLATMHLIELNHKRIGFVRGPGVSSASKLRYEGYLQAMRNYNFPVDERYIYDSSLEVESGRRIAEEFIKNKENAPTAFVIVNDLTAIGFMDVCRKNNISVPEDISLVSFDDIWCASVAGIELTTVTQHVEKMSEEAARLIIKQMQDENTSAEMVIIPPTLVARKTTSTPRQHNL